MTQLPHPYTLGDKGYVSQPLQEKLYREYEIAFWTPSRKNQCTVSPKKWAQWMRRKRKIVETTFSVLTDLFRLTAIRAIASMGDILLAYTLVVLELVEQ